MKTLAIVNQKGGVGKTTTAINLAAGLGVMEQRVLLVDCDAQGNAGRGLGVQVGQPNLYDVLTGDGALEGAIVATGFPNLDLLPSDRDLVGVEVEFAERAGWEHALRAALAPATKAYDVILLDCPPSLGRMTINALVAADGVLVPLQCEYFALEGMTELLATVERVRAALHPALALGGIVLTMYDERTNLSRDVAHEIRSHFDDLVYSTVVPRNVRLAEAPSHGLPVMRYDIKSRGSQAYLAMAREFIERGRPTPSGGT